MIQFQNADIFPAVRAAFEDVPSDANEAKEYAKAARHVDTALGILKRGYDIGSINDHEYDDILSHVEDAEAILDELGVLEDHGYLRDDIESRATELLDLDSVDTNDEADEFADEDRWMFGSDEGDDY